MARKTDQEKDENTTVTQTDAQTDASAEAEKILAAARAQAAEIVAAAQKEAEEVKDAEKQAETKKAESKPAVPPGEELVPVRLFKDNDRYKDDVFVAVNGERIQIRRGETVYIKKKFADVLQQSMDQDTATAKLIDAESSRYQSEAKARGL